jgi:8-oxo-dGTP pyrophosphatase MutT (NUDIX family)
MIRAAGILIVSKDGKALFLKRGPGGDAPGMWCVPGGRLEGTETPIDAAIRETEEETGGYKAKAKDLKPWSRTISPRETTGAVPTPAPASVDAPVPTEIDPGTGGIVVSGDGIEFTTFVLQGAEEFIPDVAKSGEHVAYAWTPLGEPPQPLHPGVAASLGKFGMHELDIAREIAAGRFASPQRYENLWLFALRITGTGMAYRRAHDEYVWRDGSLYLTQEFLDR